MKISEALEIIPQQIAENRLAEAEVLCRRVLVTSPKNPHALRWLGHIAMRARQYEMALDLLKRAAKNIKGEPALYCDIGSVLSATGDDEAAIAHQRAALQINPDYAPSLTRLAYLLAVRGRSSEAASLLRRVVQLQPDSIEAHLDLASIHYGTPRPDRAIASFQRALEIDPQNLEAELGLSNAYLLLGDLQRGFAHFECRWRLPDRVYPQTSAPRWDGSPAPGKTLLLVAEQGLGDTIQFARYIPRLEAMGMGVILACQPELHALLATVAGGAQLVSSKAALPDADFHLPLLSLPLVLHDTLDTIPRDVPYVRADPARREIFQPHLAKDALNIGIAWAGNPQHVNDRTRSMPIARLAPLAALPNIRWHGIAPIAPPTDSPIPIIDHTSRLNDFADTAALIDQLDLVITVDTAAAHVAGALAKPVWLLIAFIPDWRWVLDRTDTPWYPTMRLFRQPAIADWPSVISRVVEAMKLLRK